MFKAIISASFLAITLTTAQAWAVTYTVTLTAEQAAALAWAAKEQTARQGADLPTVTPQSLLQEQANQTADQFLSYRKDANEKDWSIKWDNLTTEDKQRVCAILPLVECK